MSTPQKVIVTHHVPDLDAIASTWLLRRFDAQEYATTHMTFVNPGDQLSEQEATQLGVSLSEVTHVDTGLGKFDHHQPDRGLQPISATSLVYDHVSQLHPDLKNDKALQVIVGFVTETDHFKEIFWPDSGNLRYSFMLHELLDGMEALHLHDDDSLITFGMTCLDAVYAHLTQISKAEELITQRGYVVDLSFGKLLAIETDNDNVIKLAQKQGYMIVVRKDTSAGHVRIKVRPDAAIDLKVVADEIKKADQQGTWYYHPSGKMLLNGSSKHRDQKPTKLSLSQLVTIIKECYVS